MAAAALMGLDRVRIFDAEPDLLDGLDERAAALLRQRATAPREWVERGPWRPPTAKESAGTLGLLVLDGLLVRTVHLDGRECPELVGPGDVLRPWDLDSGGSVEHAVTWHALERTTYATLDQSFAAIACRWPSIVGALLARPVNRSRSLVLVFAIAHIRRAEPRLYAYLWHLADRFGHVTPAGVHLPLGLTHEMLGHLTGLRRPTTTTALTRLAAEGLVLRRPDRTWLITGDEPAGFGRPALAAA